MSTLKVIASHALLQHEIPNLQGLIEVCLDHMNDAIVITEADPISTPGPRIVWVNKIFYERNGYSPQEVIGNTPRMLQGPGTDRATLDRVREALAKWQPIRAELLNYRKDGTSYWNEFEIVPVANEQGCFTHWVSVQRDTTERRQMEERVFQLAFYDPLTQLPNRRLLEDRLSQTLAASKRSGRYGALMFLDLDNFKVVNDSHGHDVGDALLRQVASQLKTCVREIDTVSRFGGDEFVVLLSDLYADQAASVQRAGVIAEKIRASIARPYTLAVSDRGQTEQRLDYHCSASIGVVMFMGQRATPIDLMKRADTAMYQAKNAGRNAIRFYQPPG
ncbi:diguanylate cyclase [Rhodoferax sp.]|uniref:diguanylate cyclase domain-containing protein n=1 Tax=Rhodoferax sp. TaxID=50421 RepID=UPI0025CCB3FA|nr:diguanylate cyclase [Rhodoferax sp.]